MRLLIISFYLELTIKNNFNAFTLKIFLHLFCIVRINNCYEKKKILNNKIYIYIYIYIYIFL